MDVVAPQRLVGLIHTLDMGGAQKIMVTILNHFVELGLEVHLIVFDNRGVFKKALSPKIVVEDLATPSVMRGMPKCLKRLKMLQPDTVFTGIGHLNIALASFIPFMKLLLPQSKWIARETNIVSLQNQVSKYPKLFDWLYRRTYNNYDVIIAQSEDMKRDLGLNYLVADKVVVIHNPIDYEKIHRAALEKIEIEFEPSTINLLSVAKLREEKRHDLMLAVVALLPEKYHLYIVGSGEKEEALKALSHHLKLENRVTFLGEKENPYPYMKSADLFLLTSQREGFPNVLLEANVLGLPIVAFACQGGIEEIVHNGVNGFHLPFGDNEAMAKKIEEASFYNFDKNLIVQSTIRGYGHEIILKKYKEIFLK